MIWLLRLLVRTDVSQASKDGAEPSGATMILIIEYCECACIPIGLEDGASKALGGNQSACQFESDQAHSQYLVNKAD